MDQIRVLEMMRELIEQNTDGAEEFFRALGENSGTEEK